MIFWMHAVLRVISAWRQTSSHLDEDAMPAQYPMGGRSLPRGPQAQHESALSSLKQEAVSPSAGHATGTGPAGADQEPNQGGERASGGCQPRLRARASCHAIGSIKARRLRNKSLASAICFREKSQSRPRAPCLFFAPHEWRSWCHGPRDRFEPSCSATNS